MTQPSTCQWTPASPEETVNLGRELGRALTGGEVIGLIGPLGAGKTHFVRGVAEGNAVGSGEARVSSPTFTLVHEYRGRLSLYHLDAYRLQSEREFLDLGFDELCRPDSVVIIEWADRVRAVLPQDLLMISFCPTGSTSRELTCEALGPVAQRCLSNLYERIQAAKTVFVTKERR